MTRRIELIDTTLRDGEQTPHVAFSTSDKVRIAESLAAVGVREIEVGTPAMGPDERQAIRAVGAANLTVRVTGWCRARVNDLDDAAHCGLRAVHISLPTSDIHLQAMEKDRDWVRRHLQVCAAVARRRFDFVSIGAQDASRAPLDFLIECAEMAESLGVDRFRLADTVGVLDPEATTSLVSQVATHVPSLAIGFHAHNDLGLATANTLAAARAGATHLDVTVAGLGERAGNAALEQVVMAMRTAWGLDLDIDTTLLRQLAQLVMTAAGRSIPSSQPIVGEGVFSHESGIHVRAIIEDRRTYQPFMPEEVGHDPIRIVRGKHSGRAAQALFQSE